MKWSEPESPGGWSSRERAIHYSDDHLCVVRECVASPHNPNGKPWTTVQRKHAVVVAAMTRDNRFVFIRQERIPVRQAIWEIPAGQVDEENPGEREIENTALRELQEETGYGLAEDGALTNLGYVLSSPGFTDEREHLFLARPVVRNKNDKHDSEPIVRQSDAPESIVDCREFSAPEVGDMIARGEIRDANTLSMFARLVARGLVSFDRTTG